MSAAPDMATHLPTVIALRAEYATAKVKMREADAAFEALRASGGTDGGMAHLAAYGAWSTWENIGARLRAAEMRLGLPATY